MEKSRFYPADIADTLCTMADNTDLGIMHDCTKALEWLKAAAENPMNFDYFRALYKVLEQITEKNKQ